MTSKLSVTTPRSHYTLPMLSHLSIRNYATAQSLDIDFRGGMTAITGETGAGKSIILGALGLTLGDRADKTVIRTGASKVDISAEFDINGIAGAVQWLRENDLAEGDDHCLLRRVVSQDGRSRAWINGTTVTLANLKTLGEMLLDIHSQHEHQSLLKRATHQRLLDEFAVDDKLLEQLQLTWRQWQQNHQQLSTLQQRANEDSAESQLLSYQLAELEELELGEDEVARLENEYKTLNNAEDLLASVNSALNLCAEDDEYNAQAMIHQALSRLQELPQRPDRLDAVLELLESAKIQVQEAAGELRAFQDEFDADPGRLEEVNNRLGTLHSLARKHRIKAAELPQFMAGLQAQLGRFEDSEAELEQLAANDRLLQKQFQKLAGDVSKQRQAGAGKLGKAVNQQLKSLGMPHARLQVALTPLETETPQQQGLETVEFLVSTNPGQAAAPLNKIASGGELSRISLAIQVIAAHSSRVPSLVFDEVDVGVGGGVARVVGELLRQLGEKTQILCVTHQAQVAGQAHHHMLVHKSTSKKATETRIESLAGDAVVKEVARMLGGEQYSEESLAHAEQMVVS